MPLTLSLVFENRDDEGLLTDYKRIDLDPDDALYLCGTMAADDGWYENMPHEAGLELRCQLIGFVDFHDPDALGEPAKFCPTCGAVVPDPSILAAIHRPDRRWRVVG
jgi:hypothetical protein